MPKRISQAIGKETILDCRITANPHIYSAWVRHGQEIENNYKYQVELYTEESKNTVTLSLRIKMIEPEDFGKYICRASNKLGKDDESVFLTGMLNGKKIIYKKNLTRLSIISVIIKHKNTNQQILCKMLYVHGY